jgi:hypothetical protein
MLQWPLETTWRVRARFLTEGRANTSLQTCMSSASRCSAARHDIPLIAWISKSSSWPGCSLAIKISGSQNDTLPMLSSCSPRGTNSMSRAYTCSALVRYPASQSQEQTHAGMLVLDGKICAIFWRVGIACAPVPSAMRLDGKHMSESAHT